MDDFEAKVDEFCVRLVNGDIQVSEIPDSFFIDVADRVKYDLSAPIIREVIHRLKFVVAEKKDELYQIEERLTAMENEIQRVDSQRANTREQIRQYEATLKNS